MKRFKNTLERSKVTAGPLTQRHAAVSCDTHTHTHTVMLEQKVAAVAAALSARCRGDAPQ